MQQTRAPLIRDNQGCYTVNGPVTDADVLAAAATVLLAKAQRLGILDSPTSVRQFLQARLAGHDCEHFDVLWLDTHNQLLAVETLAVGTINCASVWPRELLRAAIKHNAGGAIFAHNHPSGIAEPSNADRTLTETLRKALQMIGVHTLDHVVVSTAGCVSFAERGWL